ncbi:MAG: response regulator transcription factor [Sulfurospirillaceae bacterium]|nr:response regulator transcription factor [Sulfurospirillaceae bacterium]MDD2827711.1 response regulator transcription factor [Sulfurospirillaceae bacterium]
MKILLLEDNERLCKVIKGALNKEGYSVDVFMDGEEALEVLNCGYHCFILDINVPSLDGISILETIRIYHKDIPVIIISSNHDLEKIQTSYEIGCDDYLKKPFFIFELVQKVRKLCHKPIQSIALWDGFEYDYIHHRLLDANKEEIKLAKKEILFFDLFIKDRNRVVNFSELEEYVWEGEETSVENMRALIKRLRRKLPEGAIEIIKEVGYTLGKKLT